MKFTQEHIKSIIIVILSIVLLAIAYNYAGKQEPLLKTTPDDPPLPLGYSPVASTQKIQAIVLQYGSNPRGDIDKMLVAADGDSIWLHFPPHAARQILQVAKLHSSVVIEYTDRMSKKDKMGAGEIQTISNNKNETADVKNILPPPPSRGNEVTITGNKIEIKKDETGKATAFVLSNKLIVLPPHAAEDLLALITSAKTIKIKGTERSDTAGFVNINGLCLVQPDEITIDSVTYLVR